MKAKILSLSLALLLAQPALAASPKPKACPSIGALQSVGVTQADQGPLGWMAWNLKNHFGTPEEWTFIMFGLESEDAEDALTKYNAAIPTLSLIEGPTNKDDKDEWGCLYSDGTSEEDMHVIGVAATPPVSPTSLLRFKR